MKGKISFLILSGLLWTHFAMAQAPAKQPVIDTTFTDYDLLFNELDALLDSLTQPRNFILFDLGITSNYFNYESKSSFLLEPKKQLTYSPAIAFFSKSGLGISANAVIVNDGKQINPYQFYVTGSYDYLKNKKLITGLALTHFFTKNSLPFYTSPLENEAYAYFTYKKFWLKSTVAASYGWGTKSSFSEREDYVYALQLALNGYTQTNRRSSVSDFNAIVSVRHDFYWLDIFGKNDYIRLTPQLVFTSGTQQFGFNQTSNTYATIPRTGSNVLYSTDRIYLDNQLRFQPLSLTANIKTEYSKGKFFVQPQLSFDYYFPATTQNFSTAFILNTGVIF
jgi:hypothetical protein